VLHFYAFYNRTANRFLYEKSFPIHKVSKILRTSQSTRAIPFIISQNLCTKVPKTVRSWKPLFEEQADYFFVARGYAKICAYDDTTQALLEVVLSGDKPQILRIPGHYWHGFKAIGQEPVYLIYFVNKLYDYQNPDEERRPWNDPQIVPKTINGKKDDPRTGKPWDWLHPPHK
jgi:dTDP-4-dehydrorhamnose 3,5-epimerase